MKLAQRHLLGAMALLTTLLVQSAGGYELRTHATVTGQSFDASQGIRLYLQDVAADSVTIFAPDAVTRFEQLARFENKGTARGWIAEGAIREDDFQEHPVLAGFGCPQPANPRSDIDRPVNHFFDVQRGGGGLTLVGFPAQDWALGVQGRGSNPDQNQFSVRDARLYQLRSLTDSSREERERHTASLFRSLGQVIHVLQDMAQPQHTRNDGHLGCENALLRFIAGETSWYEAYVETRALNQRYRSRPESSRALLLTGYDTVVFAAYQDYWTNPNGSGLAEYSSRNFFSAGTNLGTFSLFGPCGGLAHPACDARGYVTEDFELTLPTVGGEPTAGRVRFLVRDIVDPRTGRVIPNVRVSSRSLWDQHLELSGQSPKFSLNTYNYDAMADILIPRAVGYSAGFLDYFFRGRLDGDVVIDPDDPNPDAVRFSGINASPEALGGGVLQLYGENAAGIRTPLVALDADVAVSAEPGAAVRSARFTATGDAEKFVAVYRGALGNEQPGTDAQTAPGAVIGKVLGGPRVEQIFSDGTRWYLRTPDGVVALPILAADIEDLRWGDVDNTLVGRSKLGLDPDARNLFRAYRINRPAGSITVPTTTDANGARLVDAAQTVEATLPAELAIGTVVRFAGSVRVTEDLATFEGGARSFGYDPSTGDYVPLGRPDGRPEAPGGSEVTIERTVDQVRTVTADFPVLLTKATYNNPGGLNYFWRLVEIGLDASDRLLALVEVILTEPANANGSVTVKRRNALTGVLEPAGEVLTRVSFPISPLLLALVDVRTQQVVATTAAPEVILGVDSVTPTTRMQGHATALGHDGPLDGQVITRWFELPLRAHVEPPAPPGDTPETPFLANVTVAQESGVTRLQITGRYTPTLAALVQSDITIQQSEPVRQPYLFAIEPDGNGFPVFRGFNVDTTFFGPVGYSATLQQGQRLRPSPVGEIVLLFGEPVGISEGEKGVLVRLTPSDTARLVLTDELPPAATHRLVGTTSKRTLVVSRGFETVSRLADLEAGTVAEFFGDDLGQQFVLLDPTRLYNVDDLRFYRPAPPLVKTALPRRLAGVTDNPRGDYHTIETK